LDSQRRAFGELKSVWILTKFSKTSLKVRLAKNVLSVLLYNSEASRLAEANGRKLDTLIEDFSQSRVYVEETDVVWKRRWSWIRNRHVLRKYS